MEEGSSFALALLAVESVRSAERLVSMELSADVRAVASVLVRDPVESSLPIVADIWSFIDPGGRGGGGGRCVDTCEVADEIVLMGRALLQNARGTRRGKAWDICPQIV